MKKIPAIISSAALGFFILQGCNNQTQTTSSTKDSSPSNEGTVNAQTQIELGRHLVSTGGCGDCHTPKKMSPQGPVDDSSLLLSGHPHNMPAPIIAASEIKSGIAATNTLTAWVGPWGTSYSANLTPDSTGIFGWSEEQFARCLKQGLYKGLEGSRPLMPPMPVDGVRNYTDNEVKAMFAYLKSIKPVHNVVAEYTPPANTK